MRWTSSTRSPSTDPPRERRRRLLGALLVAPLAATLAACGRKAPRAAAIAPGSTVLALGDSLTFGNGAPAASAYPARLAELTGWQVVNAGVPGDVSAQARARLPQLLAEHRPKLLLLSIGGNDFLRRVPEDDTRRNIVAMLDEAAAAGAQVVLIAVPRPALVAALMRSLDDHPLYASVAGERDLPLFASGWSRVLSEPELKADQIHANAAGYERFAADLHAFLRRSGIAPG